MGAPSAKVTNCGAHAPTPTTHGSASRRRWGAEVRASESKLGLHRPENDLKSVFTRHSGMSPSARRAPDNGAAAARLKGAVGGRARP